MKKRTTIFGLVSVLAAGAGAAGGVAAVSNYLYNHAVVPQKRDSDQPDPNPIQTAGRAWARAGEGFREAVIRSTDGLELWAALVPARVETHRWAICVHGWKDTHTSMGAIGLHYHESGWNVLLPDQRGHGKSQGSYVGFGYDERLDLLGWVNYVLRRDRQAEILLHGVSMGAATVLMATGGVLPREVKAAVSDCSYSSAEAQIRHVLNDRPDILSTTALAVPARVLFASLRKTTLHRAGYDLRNAAPIEAVAHSVTPTLFIHGDKDNFVPAAMLSKLYQAARCPKEMLWIHGAGHAEAVGTDPDAYWSAVDDLIRAHLSPEQ